eukprot:scaffold271061_cov74-Attheya_sp.AAC.1
MSTPPSADTVDTVPSIVKGALTHTTHEPNVADTTTHTPPDLTVALHREGREATEFEVVTVIVILLWGGGGGVRRGSRTAH